MLKVAEIIEKLEFTDEKPQDYEAGARRDMFHAEPPRYCFPDEELTGE